ncbi:murein hydrolase activator EnvC family protein [Paenibacillus roseus]|uniref:Peptidoglycan DD-metalloendopeptidase family protein n=2 Tax=Paenibacillus roseus TaxID=2798579 RepID=A0A934J3T6_9BACL|nr:M23 family metallopeptidase [Paenibacillus roseus]MBJ6360993.1 peptidoglycan DD-metalloendopeptidase family protein [Paenibacillus roseus]
MAVVLFQPADGQAAPSEVDKINRELEKVRIEMKAAASSKLHAQEEFKAIEQKKEEAAQSVTRIMTQISQTTENMQGVRDRLAVTEGELVEAGESLQEAEKRIEARDKLLQSRVRLLYTSGSVSYLDVLLSSTNFVDFLDRFDSIQSILSQDKTILEEHKKDKELIVIKKAEVETKLVEVKDLYGRLQVYYAQLVDKEKEKEKMILSYSEQMEELEDISAEQEALIMKLAKKASDLEKQRNRVQSHYKSGGKLLRPIGDGYRISSGFGPRTHPITGEKGKMHQGVDFPAPAGTAIYAAESGVVLVAQATSGYGNTVIIDHGNGLWTLYGHIRNGGIKVEAGENVKRGQKIAEVGTTGNSTGNHLHFEVRKNEKPQNPMSYIR